MTDERICKHINKPVGKCQLNNVQCAYPACVVAPLPSPPVSGEALQWTEAHNAATYLQYHIGEGDEGACNALDTIDKFILSCSPLTNEPVGVTLPADLARCLLVENNQHEKHLLQWTEGRATNKLDEYINLLKQSRARLSAAIGEWG